MARVLVTGAGGFVGRHLARLLVAEGHRVRGLCAHFEDPKAVAADLEFAEGDVLACDVTKAESVDAALAADAPEAVVHLAGLTFVPEANRRPGFALEVNAVGTRNLLDAVRRHAPRARFAYVSTSDVYGDLRHADLPIDEATPVHPLNAYSISKAAAELFCYQYARVWSLDVVILRPLNHTGPGQSPDFVCSDFARQVARIRLGLAEPRVRVGNLAPERDFSDVRDIIRAYALAVTMDRPEDEPAAVYNLASGRAVSIRWVLDTLIRIAGVDIRVEVDEARMRPVDIPRIVGDASKFEKATGWRPRFAIERTLEDLLHYWLEAERPN